MYVKRTVKCKTSLSFLELACLPAVAGKNLAVNVVVEKSGAASSKPRRSNLVCAAFLPNLGVLVPLARKKRNRDDSRGRGL